MEWIINQLRVHPELAIFLTLFAGFWLGRLKIGKFSLGTVTSVLLVGVLVGQLNITVDGPMKAVFFLLFLFAVGYKVGPQFFRGLKKDGLPQVGFAVLMCIVSLVAPWILAKIMMLQGRSPEQAAERLERFLSGISLDRKKILLIAPPPVALGAWVPNQQLIDDSHTFAHLCQALAERMGIRFVDAEKWDIPLAYDGVHFTEQGHRAFAAGLLEELR